MNQTSNAEADQSIQKIRIEIEIKIKIRIQKPTNIHPRAEAEATSIGQKTRRERRGDKKIMSGEELAG